MRRIPPRSVIVVGAGPAGSVAAALLARGGVEATLIEQSRSPRAKVCGDCLSDLGIQTLARHGLLQAVEQLNPQPLRAARFISPQGTQLRLPLPAQMWGITRPALDAALLEAARGAGATILQPARVERLIPGCPPTVQIRSQSPGATLARNQQQQSATLLLLADGRSLFPSGKPRPTQELGLAAHFTGLVAAEHEIALFGLSGHYVGVAPASDGAGRLWNLACTVPVARVRQLQGDHEALLAGMRRDNPALDHALRPAVRISDWHACPLPRYGVRGDWPAGVIPIGNAAAAVEPIGGEGMGLAIASAAMVAETLLQGQHQPADLAQLRRRMHRLWSIRRAACRTAALLMSHPASAEWSLRLARAVPAVARLGLAAVGKSSPAPAAVAAVA